MERLYRYPTSTRGGVKRNPDAVSVMFSDVEGPRQLHPNRPRPSREPLCRWYSHLLVGGVGHSVNQGGAS